MEQSGIVLPFLLYSHGLGKYPAWMEDVVEEVSYLLLLQAKTSCKRPRRSNASFPHYIPHDNDRVSMLRQFAANQFQFISFQQSKENLPVYILLDK
jgi:hypothetical protein